MRFLLIMVLVALPGCAASQPEPPAPKEEAKPETLEEKAHRLCTEGCEIVASCEADFNRPLTDGEKQKLRLKLLDAKDLLLKGLGCYEKSMIETGKRYEIREYTMTLKVIRMMLAELQD